MRCKAHTASQKIKKENKLYGKYKFKLHIAVHADSRRQKGSTGIKLYYIHGREASKKIAQFYQQALAEEGFEASIVPDSETRFGRLGELRDTKSPAAFFEIGNISSVEGRKKMDDPNYMDKMADVIANSTSAFIDKKAKGLK